MFHRELYVQNDTNIKSIWYNSLYTRGCTYLTNSIEFGYRMINDNAFRLGVRDSKHLFPV